MRSSNERPVLRFLIAVALAVFPVATLAAQQTIDFDDLSCGSEISCLIPYGYAGLNWDNFGVIIDATSNFPGTGYASGTISAPNVGFKGNAFPGSIAATGSPFTLNSGYFTSAFDPGITLNVIGYVGAVPTYFGNYVLDTQPSLLTFNWTNVSQVTFDMVSPLNTPFALDNLAINQSAVPEPASLALLGTGLFVLVPMLRRKTKK